MSRSWNLGTEGGGAGSPKARPPAGKADGRRLSQESRRGSTYEGFEGLEESSPDRGSVYSGFGDTTTGLDLVTRHSDWFIDEEDAGEMAGLIMGHGAIGDFFVTAPGMPPKFAITIRTKAGMSKYPLKWTGDYDYVYVVGGNEKAKFPTVASLVVHFASVEGINGQLLQMDLAAIETLQGDIMNEMEKALARAAGKDDYLTPLQKEVVAKKKAAKLAGITPAEPEATIDLEVAFEEDVYGDVEIDAAEPAEKLVWGQEYGDHTPKLICEASKLVEAAISGTPAAAEPLVKYGADVDKAYPVKSTTTNQMMPPRNALWQSASQGRTDFVTMLIKNKANPNLAMQEDGSTPLFIAAQRGHTDTVLALLKRGALPNKPTSTKMAYTPLFAATNMGHMGPVVELLKFGGDPNKVRADDGTTPIFSAAQKNNNEIMAELIKQKADCNICRTTDGTSPLVAAALNGNVEGIKQLCEGGADIDAPNKKAGANALFSAVVNRHNEAIRALLEAGANPNFTRPNVGDSVLSRAVINGDKNAVRLLVSYGADANAEVRGYTPLLIAAENDHMSVIQVLLAYGADPALKSKTAATAGTPQEAAKAKGLKDIASVLSKYSAMPVGIRAAKAAAQFKLISKDLPLAVKVVIDGVTNRKTFTLEGWMDMENLADGLAEQYPHAGMVEEFELGVQTASDIAIEVVKDRVLSKKQLKFASVVYSPLKLTSVVVQPIGFSMGSPKETIEFELSKGTLGYVRRKLANVLHLRKGHILSLQLPESTDLTSDWAEVPLENDALLLSEIDITPETVQDPIRETFRCEMEKASGSGGCIVC